MKKNKKYILQNYTDIPLIKNTFDKTAVLYYNLILDQLMNGYEKEYDKIYF